MDVQRHLRPDLEHAGGNADIGDLLRLGVFEAVERVVLREHDDGAEALVGQAEIRLADVDLDRFGIADRPGGRLRALEVAAADRDGQIGMKSAQGLGRL